MILICTQKGREVQKGALAALGNLRFFLTDGTDDTDDTDDTDFHVADYNISQEPRKVSFVESMVM